MPSGGKRPGAGRPKGSTSKPNRPVNTEAPRYDDPLAYLVAVSTGEVEADPLRIAAAKACLPFTAPKARAVVQSPPPAKLRSQNETGTEAAAQAEWRAKADEIRKRHAEKQNGNS